VIPIATDKIITGTNDPITAGNKDITGEMAVKLLGQTEGYVWGYQWIFD
jgi:hypothetical protein